MLNRRRRHNVEGTSLFYALIISLLTAILLGAFVFQAFTFNLESSSYEDYFKVQRNLKSGLAVLAARNSEGVIDFAESIDLFGNECDSVLVSSRHWGLYHVNSCMAWIHGDTLKESSLIGYGLSSAFSPALCLTNIGRGLKVCGHTEIIGELHIPINHIERAYIEGQSFVGSQLVQGRVVERKEVLPQISSAKRSWIRRITNEAPDVNWADVGEIGTNEKRDFSDETKWCYSHDSLAIADVVVDGNWAIWSEGAITLTQTCGLENTLIVAPRIYVSEGFVGSCHLVAKERIVISDEVTLKYPSSVVVCGDNSQKHSIEVGKETHVRGGVVLLSDGINDEAKMDLKSGSIVEGQVLVEGQLSAQGTVYGTTSAEGVFLRTPSSFYTGHLLNAVFDFKSLSKHFGGFEYHANQKIVKCKGL